MSNLFNRRGVYYLRYKSGGEWHKVSLKTGEKDVAEKLKAKFDHDNLMHELVGKKHPINFTAAMKRYFENHTLGLGEKTLKSYIGNSRNLVAFFGTVDLGDINKDLITQFTVERVEEDGVSHATVNRDLSLLSRLFHLARDEWGVIDSFPKIKKFSEKKFERVRWLKDFEVEKLLDELPDKVRDFMFVAFNTGGRKSELFNLKWSDIDFDTGYIYFNETKNDLRRGIPINQPLRELLYRLRQEAVDERVFCTMNTVWFYESFRAACDRAGIKNFRIHDARHTFASKLVQQGVTIQVVQKLLGHKAIKMTMRYAHLSNKSLEDAIKVLDKPKEMVSSNVTNVKFIADLVKNDVPVEVIKQLVNM